MISQRFFLAAALLAVCGLVSSANAANISVNPSVGAVFLDDFVTPAAWDSDGAGGAIVEDGQGVVAVQVDFFVEIGDLAGPPAEVGLGNINFDVGITGDASDAFGWIADTTEVDHDGVPVTPLVKVWPDNADLGTPGDLIDIVVGVAPGDFGPDGVDPRRSLGESGPEFMGSVFVNYDSDADPAGEGLVEVLMKAFSVYDENAQLNRADGQMVGGSITIVPEPASLALFGIGGMLMLIARRKRS